MTSNNEPVPAGWTYVCLRELLHGIEAGKSFECDQRRAAPDEWGVIKVSAMSWGQFDQDENKAVPSNKSIDPRYEIRTGDLLLSRSNTVELVGASVLVNACRPRLLLSDKSMRLLAVNEINRAWLQRILSSPDVRSQLSSVATGSSNSMRNVSQEKVLAIQLGLPPKSEQQRIAEKIDELISDLDAGVAALMRAKANLKRYRSAVLKAAVEGRFTEDWRVKHSNVEPALTLLERILNERRNKWEADQLSQFATAQKEPPKNWREKYIEPTPPDTTDLRQLPEGWCWATIGQLYEVKYGLSQPLKFTEPQSKDDLPVLSIKNVNSDGELILNELKYFPIPKKQRASLLLMKEDLLFNWRNAPNLIGKTVVFDLEGDYVNASFLLRLRPTASNMGGRFAWLYLNFLRLNGYFSRESNAAVNQSNFNASKTSQVVIPLPPLEEQHEIVQLAALRFYEINRSEAAISANLIRAASLRQSILKQAFDGKLVPQDPNDEPASVLLERIRANKSSNEPSAKAKPARKKKSKIAESE